MLGVVDRKSVGCDELFGDDHATIAPIQVGSLYLGRCTKLSPKHIPTEEINYKEEKSDVKAMNFDDSVIMK